MATQKNRMMVSLPPELEEDLAQVKQNLFYHDSRAGMYRQLIRQGLDAIHENDDVQEKQEPGQ